MTECAADRVIVLPAVVSPGEAVMVRNSLLAALATGDQTVIIDGSAVIELSLQGLQVLLAFIRQAEDQKCPWSLRAPSEELVAALETYGLFPRLMAWPVTM
jgi:anti-anti-sigma regulatory factor